MSQYLSPQPALRIAIIVIQLFDIVIHVASGQAEPLRILSNLVIIGWLLLYNQLAPRFSQLSLVAIAVYLLLNAIFLFQHGVTNAGSPRIVMFVLVLLTTILSWLFSSRVASSQSK